LRAIHEYRAAAAFSFHFIAERADQIRAQNSLIRTDYFRMNGVIDQRGEWFAVDANGLDDMTPRVVELFGVIVVGDFSFGFAGGDFEGGGLQLSDRFIDRFGHAIANEVEVFKISREPAFAVRETVTVRRAVSMSRANQNVFGHNRFDLCSRLVCQHRGKAKKVSAHNRHTHVIVLEHQRANRQVALLPVDRMRRPDPA